MASRLQFISISIEYLQQIWMVATVPSLSYNQTVTLNLEIEYVVGKGT